MNVNGFYYVIFEDGSRTEMYGTVLILAEIFPDAVAIVKGDLWDARYLDGWQAGLDSGDKNARYYSNDLDPED